MPNHDSVQNEIQNKEGREECFAAIITDAALKPNPMRVQGREKTKQPLVAVVLEQIKATALIDTGATRSLISATLFRQFGWSDEVRRARRTPHNMQLRSASGQRIPIIGTYMMIMQVGKKWITDEFLVIDSESSEQPFITSQLILGWDIMQKYRMTLHAEVGVLQVDTNRWGGKA
jgi:hypothetical protein